MVGRRSSYDGRYSVISKLVCLSASKQIDRVDKKTRKIFYFIPDPNKFGYYEHKKGGYESPQKTPKTHIQIL